MHAADRADWTEWCEIVNHRLERGDCIVAGVDGHDRALTWIDYDPFDDEIEIALTKPAQHILIERPGHVLVPDGDEDVFAIEIVSGVDSIELKDVTFGKGRRRAVRDSQIPPELQGAYFGG